MKSSSTKKVLRELWIYRVLDILILTSPLAIYFIIGLAEDGAVVQKVGLVGSVMVALMLTLFNVITKRHLRSPIWIVMIGMYFAIDNIIPLLFIIAIGSILDEFVLSPTITKKKMQYEANVVYDQREEEKE